MGKDQHVEHEVRVTSDSVYKKTANAAGTSIKGNALRLHQLPPMFLLLARGVVCLVRCFVILVSIY